MEPRMENLWSKKTEVIKGDYGENLVKKYLEEKGWVVYAPITDGPHAFDRLCVKDKKHIVIAEVKSKSRLNNLNATGFNYKHFKEYKEIQDKHKLNVFVFFVDEYLKKIYGNKLSILESPYQAKDGIYPKMIANNKIIIFSLEVMKIINSLTEEDCKFLRNNSTRNYDYKIKG